MFTVLGCNELIFLLLQKFVHLLYFVLVVFLHAADIIACPSDKIDVADAAMGISRDIWQCRSKWHPMLVL